jgi:hypothetical protein
MSGTAQSFEVPSHTSVLFGRRGAGSVPTEELIIINEIKLCFTYCLVSLHSQIDTQHHPLHQTYGEAKSNSASA